MSPPRDRGAVRSRARYPLWAAVLCSGVLLPGAGNASSALVYETNLTGSPPLGRPISVTLAASGLEFCVTDERERTINVFDAAGLHRYRTDEVSRLSSPKDAWIDSQAGFVFTDRVEGIRTIRRLNFLGEPVPYEPETPHEGWSPNHLMVTADGNFVTLDGDGLLCKHDESDGSLLWSRQLMELGSEQVEVLGAPAESPDGLIYIPNGMEGVVMVYGSDGEPQTLFGRKGSRPGEFSFPSAIAFAADGRILVLDRMKHKVIIFGADHGFLVEWGGIGSAPGAFYGVTDLAVTSDGRVLVTQGYEGRVQVYEGFLPAAEPPLPDWELYDFEEDPP